MAEVTSLLDEKNFLTRFSTGQSTEKAVRALQALLARLASTVELSERCEWLEDLSAWLFSRGEVPGPNRNSSSPTAHLRLVLDVLDEMPEQKAQLRATVGELFAQLSMVHLFTDTGLPGQMSFFSELVNRFSRAVLPEPPVEREASRLLYRLFPSERAASWFARLDAGLVGRLFETLAVPSGPELEPLRAAMRDAAILLSVRVAAHGTADDVRERTPETPISASPFLALPKHVRALVAPGSKAPGGVDPAVEVRETIAACRKLKRSVRASLDSTGISITLVYRLEYLRHLLDRLYIMLSLLAPATGTAARGVSFVLLQTLVRGGVRERSMLQVLRTNSGMLARRVIERTGRTGEHYITRTRAEQHDMVDSAGGGGVLTAFSVVVKFIIGWAHLPILLDSVANSLNYATAFVTMQLGGFTLATKQPSMTAAALAGSIKETGESPNLAPLVDQVERTIRTQLAAILGNVGMVLPTVMVVGLLVRLATGHHLIDATYADKIIRTHHPITSATALFAGLTGVYLWVASLLGHTVENWFVVRQLPGAIASNRTLRALLGSQRAAKVSDFFVRQIAGLGTNIGFGFILGLVPMLFGLIGIPLEVRHITFATGQLAFAGLSRGAVGVLQPDYLWALSSIVLIGSLNFSVSFTLALVVAFRARDVNASEQVRLVMAVLRRLRERPMDFIRAPRAATLTTATTLPTPLVASEVEEPAHLP